MKINIFVCWKIMVLWLVKDFKEILMKKLLRIVKFVIFGCYKIYDIIEYLYKYKRKGVNYYFYVLVIDYFFFLELMVVGILIYYY